MPTPILYGDYLYICRNNGILLCYDARTGEEVYKNRVGSMRSAFSASPIAADGKLYFTDEYGGIHIIKAGSEFEHLNTNELNESCLATPSISGNLLFVRTLGHLFAIGEGGKTEGIQTRVEEEEPAEKIDFSKVKTDGSINDAKELMKIAAAKWLTITSVEYDISVKGAETEETSFGLFTAKAQLYGTANYGLPEYFRIEGEYKMPEKDTRSFVGGSDGQEFYYKDKVKDSLKKGIEFADLGAHFQNLFNGIVMDLVSNEPFSLEQDAAKKEIKEVKDVNGVPCYELYFAFPQYRNYEIIWYISVETFIPQARTIKYTMRDGKRGGSVQTLSNITINRHSDPSIYKIEE
jgi:hypothetical protein